MNRLARLEIERPVLHLHQHVVPELAIERLEFVVALLDAVFLAVGIDERAPHDEPAVRPDGIGQHVGAIGMRPVVVLRARLSLRVGFHQKAAEVGNRPVDLVRLGAPPRRDGRVERVGGLQGADLDRCAESGAQVHADAVGPEQLRERCRLFDIAGVEHIGGRVHIREHGAVDSDGSTGAGVVGVAGIHGVRQVVPFPDRASRITSLDRSIEIVPVVEDPMLYARYGRDVQMIECLPRLHEPQEMKHAVQHAHILVRGDGGRSMSAERHGADHVPLRASGGQIQMQTGNQCRGPGRSQDDGSVLCDVGVNRRSETQQAVQAAQQLCSSDAQSIRRRAGDHLGGSAPVPANPFLPDGMISEPQLVAVFGRGSRAQAREQGAGEEGEAKRSNESAGHTDSLREPRW